MLRTRSPLVVLGLVLAALSLGAAPVPAPPPPAPEAVASVPHVVISGVYMHGFLPGVPNADSAVRLINLDPAQAVDIGGWALSDKLTPRKVRKRDKDPRFADDEPDEVSDEPAPEPESPDGGPAKPARGRPKENRTVRFPAGTRIPPGGEIWVAETATGFRQSFGDPPAFEATESDPKVPNLEPARGFLWLNEGYGTVALLDPKGTTVDFVAWQGAKQKGFPEGSLDAAPWRGEPVALAENSAYGWKGRVLGRARDEAARVLPDTDKATDWPVGFSATLLGQQPTHRVEFPGQSRFVAQPIANVRAKVLATSAPDNNFAALIAAFDSAKKELRVRVYELTNPKIADGMIKARKRGVKVLLYLEGAPVGGIADQERWLVDRISKAGIPVHFLATPKDSPIKPRYRFDHSKYVLVDDRLAVIGTENYGRTGVPVVPTFGNRGWMVHIEQPELVRQLRAVWDADYRPATASDILSIDASPNDTYGMPYRDKHFVPSDKLPSGLYASPAKPVAVDDTMGLELVLSPDTSLNENSAIIGMIARAKTSVYLEQNSVLPYWGKKKKAKDEGDGGGGRRGKKHNDWSDPDEKGEKGDKDDKDDDRARPPSLPVQAVIAAARRGVKVRVLLDGTWYNDEATDDRDNDDTVRMLNELGVNEGLDIAAKVINLESTHLEKIHAKGVIVDEREVFVGSINWSENAFEGNREVGVIVSHPKVAGYYADLFKRDWSQSRLYGAPLTAGCDVRAGPDAGARVLTKKKVGERLDVVFERGKKGGGSAWIEVALGLGKTGFVAPEVLGMPEVTAFESMYVIGREAVVTDVVEGVRVSGKVTQLQLRDKERSPFVAVIFKGDEAAFVAAGMPPATAFLHKKVRITGKVKVYKVPEIVVGKPTQIQIVH